MNISSLIPAAAALYYMYSSQKDTQTSLDKLKSDIEDEVTARTLALQDDIDNLANPLPEVIANMKIVPTAYFRSIADQYWTSAYYVKVTNNSKQIVQLYGLRLTFSLDGNICDYQPYFVGNVTLQAGQTINIRLTGSYVMRIFDNKTQREAARQYLKAAGKGHSVTMLADAEVVVAVKGTAGNVKGEQTDLTGLAYYEPDQLPNGAKWNTSKIDKRSQANYTIFDGSKDQQ